MSFPFKRKSVRTLLEPILFRRHALIVASYNGKASVTLYFSVLQEVAGVTLDQEVIEF